MHILLIYGEGRVEEALLLSSREGRMRVMRRGQADAVEFCMREGTWTSESGTTVQIGAALPVVSSLDEPGFCAARLRAGAIVDRFKHVMAN